MDRDEALKLLKEGQIEDWNQRRARAEEIPPLEKADLRGTDLRRTDLRGADLSGAKMGGTALCSLRACYELHWKYEAAL